MASKPMTPNAMNDETGILSEADEIAALLPWYVSGKISAADRARVDAYAKAHTEVIDHIALARAEADAVFADNAKIAAPRATLDRLQKSIAATPRARMNAVRASFLDQMGAWLQGLAPRHLAYAGLAAVALLVIQAVSVSSLLSQQPGQFQVAGKDAVAAKGTVLLVAFQPAAPQSTVTAFLAGQGFTVVDGPKAGGLYRVRVADTVLAQNDIDATIAKFKARVDLVAFVSAASYTP